MNKLPKEQFQVSLRKGILECTEEEIKFAFHLLNFDLKNFRQEVGRVEFEVHFNRYYIIKITVLPDKTIFSNEWIIFNDNTKVHHVQLDHPGNLLIMVINQMVNMFGPSLLAPLRYNPAFIEGWSVFENGEEAHAYYDIFVSVIHEIYPEMKEPVKEEGKVAKPAKKSTKAAKAAQATRKVKEGKSSGTAKVIPLPITKGKKKLPN